MEKKFAENLRKAVFFTLDRKKDDGGFGATPKLPATLEDTYHGLRILDGVERYCGLPKGVELERELHSQFLLYFVSKKPNLGMKGAYQLIWCMKRCSLCAKAERIAKKDFLNSTPQGLEDIYYAMSICWLLDLTTPFGFSSQKLAQTVTFKGILFKRWMAIFIDKMTGGGLIDQRKASNWIKKCQNYDGGFGFLPGSTSYLENTHFALHALGFLNESTLDRENATRFVIGCQTKNGGFSRKADAAPFLDATWHGVASLILNSNNNDLLRVTP